MTRLNIMRILDDHSINYHLDNESRVIAHDEVWILDNNKQYPLSKRFDIEHIDITDWSSEELYAWLGY